MSEAIPAIFEEGVFKPLKKVDFPEKQQLYILVGRSKNEVEKGLFFESSAENSVAEKIYALVEELKADLGYLKDLDFRFDAEHQKMFLENADALAPFIPSMISDDLATEEDQVE